jgi:hypothetical protein
MNAVVMFDIVALVSCQTQSFGRLSAREDERHFHDRRPDADEQARGVPHPLLRLTYFTPNGYIPDIVLVFC